MEQKTENHNIIAVASGKGGVGKTWLSITLSHLLARSGRRILLFDGDIGLANVDVQLGLMPEKDLGTVLEEKATLREIIYKHESGIDILSGKSGSTRLSLISLAKLNNVKQQLMEIAKDYDAVIIDIGAGIEQYVQFMASMAANCVVIVNEEPTSLTDAYAFIKLCNSRFKNLKINIVVNQASSQKEGEKTFSALEKACTSFLNMTPSLLGVIRKDNKVKDAIRSQTPMLDKSPTTIAATDCAAISVKIIQKL